MVLADPAELRSPGLRRQKNRKAIAPGGRKIHGKRMESRQVRLTDPAAAGAALAELAALRPQLVLVFAALNYLEDRGFLAALRQAFPDSQRVGCSTAGEISAHGVSNGSAVVTAVRFDQPAFCVARTGHTDMAASADTGRRLGRQLKQPGLHSVMLFGAGVNINGSALIDGVVDEAGTGVKLTGGLAGDDGAFRRTLTLLNDEVSAEQVVGIGFCSPALRLGHGCVGGWEPFGAVRRITRAHGNVLYELDGQPALDLYKRYLGEYAKGLPASGLLFPFEMLDSKQSEVGLIRTILGVDEAARSLTLAGSLIDDGYLRLMQASTDALVNGAEQAASAARGPQCEGREGLALLVSCVGRKLVMGERVDEEIEAVADVYGRGATLAGFYSYGEISPLNSTPECKLHNQTMAVTYLCEGP